MRHVAAHLATCGLQALAAFSPLGLERRDAETDQAPEPDPALRAFEKDVEGRVHHERQPERENPEVHTRPPFASLATCSKERDDQRERERGLQEAPDDQPWHACARQHGHLDVVRASIRKSVHRSLIVVVIGQVDAESLARPEITAVYGVVDDVLPPLKAPRARALEVARVGFSAADAA